MCAVASSTPLTTRTARSIDKYSVSQSAFGCLHDHLRVDGRLGHRRWRGWQRRRGLSPPRSVRRVIAATRKRGATSAWTSKVSTALHTPTRCVFAFMTIASAALRSAEASTYRWQLPVPVSMTGTRDCSTTALMRPAPPRGNECVDLLRAPASSPGHPRAPTGRRVWIASAGRPTEVRASRHTSMSTRFEDWAALPPRRMTALPALSARVAASIGDVGAGLVDDADDTQGHALLGDAQADVRAHSAHDLADRVRQGYDLANGRRRCLECGQGSAPGDPVAPRSSAPRDRAPRPRRSQPGSGRCARTSAAAIASSPRFFA